MLVKNKYYEIVIKEKNMVEVFKINSAKYNYFKNIFDDVYRTENGKKYPLEKELKSGTNIIIVDDFHLYDLLMDLSKQGYCDKKQACLALVMMEDWF